MHWGEIVPALLIGCFGGWLYGIVRGHGETQTLLEKQHRRLTEMLDIVYRGQRDHIETVDILVDAALADSHLERERIRSLWWDRRDDLISDRSLLSTEFYQQKYPDEP